MMKKWICFCLCLLMLVPTHLAGAESEPRPITPLAVEDVPEPFIGQHHYLLACIDDWEADADLMGNTDGVILATMDTEQDRLMFTTFMREMLVARPNGTPGRITYIAKTHGPEMLAQTISTHFGVKVEKYILFNMDDVQTIIDAMGGVFITVTDAEADYLNRYRISRDSTTPSMDKGGTYLFGGHAAVIYMRIRKVGGDGDLGRNRRMRTVLSTLATQFSEIGLEEALMLLDMVINNQIQTNMTTTEMMQAVGYAMELRGVTPEDLQMPLTEALSPITYAGMDTYQVNFDLCREAMETFLLGE